MGDVALVIHSLGGVHMHTNTDFYKGFVGKVYKVLIENHNASTYNKLKTRIAPMK